MLSLGVLRRSRLRESFLAAAPPSASHSDASEWRFRRDVHLQAHDVLCKCFGVEAQLAPKHVPSSKRVATALGCWQLLHLAVSDASLLLSFTVAASAWPVISETIIRDG
jgi:hypothetical protein